MNKVDYSLERRAQWGQYRRCIRMAAECLNDAQKYHRELFEKENEGLLAATLAVSIENEKANGS